MYKLIHVCRKHRPCHKVEVEVAKCCWKWKIVNTHHKPPDIRHVMSVPFSQPHSFSWLEGFSVFPQEWCFELFLVSGLSHKCDVSCYGRALISSHKCGNLLFDIYWTLKLYFPSPHFLSSAYLGPAYLCSDQTPPPPPTFYFFFFSPVLTPSQHVAECK